MDLVDAQARIRSPTGDRSAPANLLRYVAPVLLKERQSKLNACSRPAIPVRFVLLAPAAPASRSGGSHRQRTPRSGRRSPGAGRHSDQDAGPSPFAPRRARSRAGPRTKAPRGLTWRDGGSVVPARGHAQLVRIGVVLGREDAPVGAKHDPGASLVDAGKRLSEVVRPRA